MMLPLFNSPNKLTQANFPLMKSYTPHGDLIEMKINNRHSSRQSVIAGYFWIQRNLESDSFKIKDNQLLSKIIFGMDCDPEPLSSVITGALLFGKDYERSDDVGVYFRQYLILSLIEKYLSNPMFFKKDISSQIGSALDSCFNNESKVEPANDLMKDEQFKSSLKNMLSDCLQRMDASKNLLLRSSAAQKNLTSPLI